jgi:hypothetical protein
MTTLAGYSERERRTIIQPPTGFLCPLRNTVMMDPVMSEETGINFERSAILAWKSLRGDTCPVTGGKLGELVPSKHLQEQIYEWMQQQQYIVSQFPRRTRMMTNAPVNHNAVPANVPDCVPDRVQANFTNDVQNTTTTTRSASFFIASRMNKKPRQSPEAMKKKQEQTLDIVRSLASSRMELYAQQIERKAFKKRQPYQSKSIFKRGARLPIVRVAPSRSATP